MSRSTATLAAAAALTVCLLSGWRTVAHASTYPFLLEGVTFSDGETASGTFGINTYGYVDTFDVVTTGAAGATYTPTIQGGVDATDTILTLARPGYDGGITFTFEYALDASGQSFGDLDPIVSGSECGTYTCTPLNERTITAGAAEFVPEPVSITLLGAGLIGLGIARRRGAA